MTITTDSSPLYAKLIKEYFPAAKHILINSDQRLKKKRELLYTAEQKKFFDPLFALNQRCAMLRSDLRRLTRRSWCTTKKKENLLGQLELYQVYNNLQLSSLNWTIWDCVWLQLNHFNSFKKSNDIQPAKFRLRGQSIGGVSKSHAWARSIFLTVKNFFVVPVFGKSFIGT